MEAWQTILLAFGGNAVLLTVLAWLARAMVRASLDRDLERYKSSLDRDLEQFRSALLVETQSAIERLRHGLQLVGQEHQIVFSKLQERRAAVIAEVYGLLVEAYWFGSSFASPMELQGEPPKQEKYVAAMDAMANFYRFFDKNRIYLPEKMCEAIDSLTKEMRSQVLRVGTYVKYDDDRLPEAARKKKWDALDAAWDYFEKQAPTARRLLERELRMLIGDKPDGSGPAAGTPGEEVRGHS